MKLLRSRSPALEATATLLSLALLVTPVLAMLQCGNIVVDGEKFDFSALNGPHSVVTTHKPPSVYELVNTTYTLDICKSLKKDGPASESCPNGARVCAIKRGKREGSTDYEVSDVISIAGELQNHGGGPLDAEVTRLKTSDSNADSKKQGVRIKLNGGKHELTSGGRRQQAIVEMVCDPNKDGTEGEWTPEDDKYEQGPIEGEEDGAPATRQRGVKRQDGDGDGDGATEEHQLLKDNAALIFDSYGPSGDVDILRLTWHTKLACEGEAGNGGSNNEHWGFFTWVFILTFLGTASYLIFGSWLNYNRYGARGWDLLPHGDTIRDIPYLMKDWTRRVLNTVQGTGSRGGYSAV